MMRALLGKDWRVNRAAVIGGVVVAVCPYAVMLWSQVWYPPAGGNTPATYLRTVENAAEIGMLLTLVMAAVFGSMAFAAERRDRSAEFVAMLPVTRGPIVLSKLCVGVGCVVMLAVVHASLFVFAVTHAQASNAAVPAGHTLGVLVAILVLYFALGWTLSLYLQSPGLAAAVAMGVATGVYVLTALRAERAVTSQHWLRADASRTIVITCFMVAVVAFVGSTVHYLRRVRV